MDLAEEKTKAYNGRNNQDTLANAARLMRSAIPNIDERTIGALSARMAHVAHPDCMALLVLAASGFTSTLDSPKEMGMEIKRYYTAIEKLKDDGLIAKASDSGLYSLTTRGKLELARLVLALQDTAGEKRLEFIEDILKVRAFDGDVRKVLEFFEGNTPAARLSRT